MSVDGDHWVEGTIEAPSEPALEAARPCSVVAFDGGLLATASTEGAKLAWTSIDGRSWAFAESLPISGGGSETLASMGNQVLLVGYRADPEAANGLRQVLLHGVAGP
jgi:hypothetical protein